MQTFTELYNPTKPYASNDLRFGVKRQLKEKALEMLYIETNGYHTGNLLVADIDSEDSAWELKEKVFDDDSLPTPHFITTNPLSNHSHAGWFLEGFAINEKQNYVFRQLQASLNTLAGGDPNYTGGIMRNPLSALQNTEFFDAPLYSFSDIKSFIPKSLLERPVSRFEGVLEEAEGRNCFLFSEGRRWAYRAYYRALKDGSESLFGDLLISQIQELNRQLDTPLSRAEVRSIANSIYRFLMRNFSLAKAEAKFEAGRTKSLQVRRQGAIDKYLAIKEITDQGHSLKLACDTLGFNYNSVRVSIKKWESEFGEK